MELDFLSRALPSEFVQKIDDKSERISRERMWTTLTFAQSLDGKIAGAGGKQLILSGKESMLMTHWMRAMHDAILVGINTVINDDPQLNTRLLSPRQDGSVYASPQPIILDTTLRLPIDCKLLNNSAEGRGKPPILVCGPPSVDHEMAERMFALMERGATVITLPLDDAGRISLEDVCDSLFARGYRSLMIEGGQSVISSCLAESKLALDRVVITVAPVFIGSEGVGVTGQEIPVTKRLRSVASGTLGDDIVVAYKVPDTC